jgi:hypothetical protein
MSALCATARIFLKDFRRRCSSISSIRTSWRQQLRKFVSITFTVDARQVLNHKDLDIPNFFYDSQSTPACSGFSLRGTLGPPDTAAQRLLDEVIAPPQVPTRRCALEL